VPAQAQAGFLTAVAALVDGSVRAARASGSARHGGMVQYVFGQRTFELRLREHEPAAVASGGGIIRAVRQSFEIRNPATGDRTRFEMTCGIDGELAGVPLTVQWQPRWWLRVELHVQQGGD
jgi:hypothetical protein